MTTTYLPHAPAAKPTTDNDPPMATRRAIREAGRRRWARRNAETAAAFDDPDPLDALFPNR